MIAFIAVSIYLGRMVSFSIMNIEELRFVAERKILEQTGMYPSFE